jgi:hypothetical protein
MVSRSHTYEVGDLLKHAALHIAPYTLLVLERMADTENEYNLVYRVLDTRDGSIYIENQLYVDESYERIG